MTMDHEAFRELLDAATGTAPPAPPASVHVAAGRTRLRRLRLGVAGAGAVVVTVAIAAGSALGGSPATSDDPAQFASEAPTSTPSPGAVDPRVLADVVEGAFPTPGDGQLRNIRVQTFLYGWALERCGGTAAPLDSTADRFEQDLFPHLDLIRERGFTERSQASFDGYREGCQFRDELTAGAPAWTTWRDLLGPWIERATDLLRDDGFVPLREDMAQCLRDSAVMPISSEDPVGSLMGSIDGAEMRGGLDPDVKQQRTAAFADCGADYFGKFEERLQAERLPLVEQHRELLEEFARQLSALGYTP